MNCHIWPDTCCNHETSIKNNTQWSDRPNILISDSNRAFKGTQWTSMWIINGIQWSPIKLAFTPKNYWLDVQQSSDVLFDVHLTCHVYWFERDDALKWFRSHHEDWWGELKWFVISKNTVLLLDHVLILSIARNRHETFMTWCAFIRRRYVCDYSTKWGMKGESTQISKGGLLRMKTQ